MRAWRTSGRSSCSPPTSARSPASKTCAPPSTCSRMRRTRASPRCSSTWRVGGGRYFQATSEEAIINALRQILIEIQSVNAVFASASLPINATNRSQNENQVFIGMFGPDADANPRWYGNLKRYQIGLFGAEAKLPTRTATRQCRPRPASSSLRDQLLDDRQRQLLELLAESAGLCRWCPLQRSSPTRPTARTSRRARQPRWCARATIRLLTDATPTNAVARTIYLARASRPASSASRSISSTRASSARRRSARRTSSSTAPGRLRARRGRRRP